MHIGLIGGIGVAATIVYYQRLTAAMNAKGVRLRLTISHGDVQTLIANNLADLRQKQAEIFARQIDELKGAGAEVAALTSLGGHFCFDELKPLSSLPLVSGVTPLDAYFAAQGLRRVGLIENPDIGALGGRQPPFPGSCRGGATPARNQCEGKKAGNDSAPIATIYFIRHRFQRRLPR